MAGWPSAGASAWDERGDANANGRVDGAPMEGEIWGGGFHICVNGRSCGRDAAAGGAGCGRDELEAERAPGGCAWIPLLKVRPRDAGGIRPWAGGMREG